MIKRGRQAIKSHMTLEYEFSGIRIQETILTPVSWKLSVDLVAVGPKGKSKEDIEHDAGTAYQKVYFWLETNLPAIAVVNVQNESDFYLANMIGNISMYCPANPGDDTLIRLLHSKISALAYPELIVGEMHLKGSDTALQYTFDSSDGDHMLPTKTSEYLKGWVIKDDVPWWERPDGFCFEFAVPEDAAETLEEIYKDVEDPMEEFYRVIDEVDNAHNIGLVKEPAKIVQIEKWKPKTV